MCLVLRNPQLDPALQWGPEIPKMANYPLSNDHLGATFDARSIYEASAEDSHLDGDTIDTWELLRPYLFLYLCAIKRHDREGGRHLSVSDSQYGASDRPTEIKRQTIDKPTEPWLPTDRQYLL